jgi:N6-adenosine-specific RNA methylase IME4
VTPAPTSACPRGPAPASFGVGDLVGHLQLGPVTFTATGAVVDGKPSFEVWREALAVARRAESGALWWVGDLLNYGEAVYGKSYSQAMDATGLDYQTVKVAKWVASRIELVRRRTNLSFAHHREIAPLDPEEQNRWLDRAEHEGWTRSELRRQIQQERGRAALTEAGAFPGVGYRVLYVDPPWRYAASETECRRVENHYATMPVEQIEGMAAEVAAVTAPDCVLLCWATSPLLREALRVVAAWGFEYRTCAVWVKDRIGMGYYFRQRHELLLVGTKGKPALPEPAVRPDSVVMADRTEHSRKPEAVYDLIERMYPHGPRLELFARQARAGWDRWGAEAPPQTEG